MKTAIYTRKGDAGYTSLGKYKSCKDHPLVHIFGSIDELNSFLGLAVAFLEQHKHIDSINELVTNCIRVQHELFNLGVQVADITKVPSINDKNVKQLEMEIDSMTKLLPELHNFILPGGGEGSARFHVARTVCRRVERKLVELAKNDSNNDLFVQYVNRLSDWLFTAARFSSTMLGEKECLWDKEVVGD